MTAPIYTREQVCEVYKQHGSIRAVTDETGCPPYTAFIWLKKAGVLNSVDSVRYGTQASRNGGAAEKEFKRLVPKAMAANEHLNANCPSFDFDINGWTVDVKFSSINKTGTYRFATAGAKALRPDFFCVFACSKGSIQSGYRILLIPEDMISNSFSFRFRDGDTSDDEVWLYEVMPEDLAGIFEDDKSTIKGAKK